MRGMVSEERRLHPRAVVKLEARLLRKGAAVWEDVLVHDLSAGGAGIRSRFPLGGQDEVRLRFQIPGEPGGEAARIDVLALVVRLAAEDRTDAGRPFAAGLHFLTLQGESFERVRVFVWKGLHPDEP